MIKNLRGRRDRTAMEERIPPRRTKVRGLCGPAGRIGRFFFSMPIACKSERLDQGTPCLPHDVVVGTADSHTAPLSSGLKNTPQKSSIYQQRLLCGVHFINLPSDGNGIFTECPARHSANMPLLSSVCYLTLDKKGSNEHFCQSLCRR